MFALGAIILMLCADLSSALIECDRTRQHPVQSKKSGKILGCVDCRTCKPGLQPKFPCGTVVGVEDSIGDCEECKVGYHSAKEDVHPCQPCQVLKCSKHEIVVGTCKIDEPDSSHCTGHCKRGYVMNSNRICEADELHQGATKDSGLSIGEIISIIFGVFLAVAIIIMIGLCWWYFKCRSNNTEVLFEVVSSDNKSIDNTDAELLGEKKESLIIQEESQSNGGSIVNKPLCPETAAGFASTVPTSSETIQSTCILSTQGNGCESVTIDMQGLLATSQTHSNVETLVLTRLSDLPSKTYQKICKTFNTGTHGINDWEVLAGWLEFSAEMVRSCELEKNKADAVIRCWETKTENTIAKFVEILKVNSMTNLVDEINKACKV